MYLADEYPSAYGCHSESGRVSSIQSRQTEGRRRRAPKQLCGGALVAERADRETREGQRYGSFKRRTRITENAEKLWHESSLEALPNSQHHTRALRQKIFKYSEINSGSTFGLPPDRLS